MLKISTVVFCMLGISSLKAQDYKLKDISEKELLQEFYENDSTAPAVYLNRVRETYLDYKSSSGWFFINEITERIKILNKEGLDYGTKKLSSYVDGSEEEKVEDIRGVTYNLNSGKIVKSTLEKGSVFETERSEHWNETAFAMPDVQVGSIVEWSYKTISPFYKIDDLIMQENIPVVNYYAKIRTPGMFQFRRLKKGNFEVNLKESIKKESLSVDGNYNQTTYVSYNELVAEYEQNDIPALKEEIFVTNPENYRRSILYELISTEFNEGNKKEYSTTWDKVARSVFKHNKFGSQFDKTGFLQKIATRIVEENPTEDGQIIACLQFIKSKIKWNGKYGKYVDEGVVKAYKEGVGNVSEVNILLTALLQECGIEANPVLISTKRFGIPFFPTLEGYNYVIAGIRKNGKTTLLDATDKLSAPNILPTRVYNWKGRMINKIGVSQEIDLMETITPRSNTYINAQISIDGSITGELKQRFNNLEALDLRHEMAGVGIEKWQEYRQEKYGLDELFDYSLEDVEQLEKPVVESFSFKIDQGFDIIGDQLLITPLLFLKLSESPFKSDERQYPVDFDYPFSKDLAMNLNLPEGYSVSSLPEPLTISLPDDAGNFYYSLSDAGGVIQVVVRFNLKNNTIPVHFYPSLKEFYKMRVEKENEKIILRKSL